MAGARVAFGKIEELKVADVYLNGYASLRAIVRGVFHEGEHLKNPARLGDPKEEAEIIGRSYQMLHDLDSILQEDQQQTMRVV